MRYALWSTVALIAVVGCGAGGGDAPASPPSPTWGTDPAVSDSEYSIFQRSSRDFLHTLPDGRKVTCIWFDTSGDGALSCDWAGAR